MYSAFRRRLIVITAAVLGGLTWLSTVTWLMAPDGSPGLSLLDARIGLVGAVLLMAVTGVPAVVLGLLAASLTRPLSGLFAIAVALMFPAAAGGSIEGFFRRSDSLGAFGALIGEAVLWLAALAGVLGLFVWLVPKLRARLGPWAAPPDGRSPLELDLPRTTGAWMAGLICAVVGGAGSWVLIQTPDTGQVIGSLLLGFTVAGVMAYLLVPQPNPAMILVAPLVVGLVGYAQTLLSYESYEAALASVNRSDFWGHALGLPIHYASAGVTGALLGIGIGRSFEQPEPAGQVADQAGQASGSG